MKFWHLAAALVFGYMFGAIVESNCQLNGTQLFTSSIIGIFWMLLIAAFEPLVRKVLKTDKKFKILDSDDVGDKEIPLSDAKPLVIMVDTKPEDRNILVEPITSGNLVRRILSGNQDADAVLPTEARLEEADPIIDIGLYKIIVPGSKPGKFEKRHMWVIPRNAE